MSKRRGPVTAEELMNELIQDPGYRTFLEDVEQEKELNRQNYRREAAGLLSDLAEVGFDVDYVGELVKRRVRYEAAIPVLIRWLPVIGDRSVKEDVIRTLSVPWARPDALKPLIEEFKKLPPEEEIGLRWVVGNALEITADDSVFEEVRDLATTPSYGRSREMVVASLGNMKNQEAIEVLIDLLEDETVVGHAVMALGKLKAKKARPKIKPLLEHPQAWIRKEAKKALARIG